MLTPKFLRSAWVRLLAHAAEPLTKVAELVLHARAGASATGARLECRGRHREREQDRGSFHLFACAGRRVRYLRLSGEKSRAILTERMIYRAGAREEAGTES